jgi:hypothetical protein
VPRVTPPRSVLLPLALGVGVCEGKSAWCCEEGRNGGDDNVSGESDEYGTLQRTHVAAPGVDLGQQVLLLVVVDARQEHRCTDGDVGRRLDVVIKNVEERIEHVVGAVLAALVAADDRAEDSHLGLRVIDEIRDTGEEGGVLAEVDREAAIISGCFALATAWEKTHAMTSRSGSSSSVARFVSAPLERLAPKASRRDDEDGAAPPPLPPSDGKLSPRAAGWLRPLRSRPEVPLGPAAEDAPRGSSKVIETWTLRARAISRCDIWDACCRVGAERRGRTSALESRSCYLSSCDTYLCQLMDLEVHVGAKNYKLLLEALRVVAREVGLDKVVLELLVVLEAVAGEGLASASLRKWPPTRQEGIHKALTPERLQTKQSSCRSFMCLARSSSAKKHERQNWHLRRAGSGLSQFWGILRAARKSEPHIGWTPISGVISMPRGSAGGRPRAGTRDGR